MPVLNYVCSLSEKTIAKAKKEVNEDSKERLGAIQAFEEWIRREPWINAPADPYFLLSFLRWGKFSQLRARERLVNYLKSYTTKESPYGYIRGHDPGDPNSLEILREGTHLILPGTDKKGRRVIFGRLGFIDTNRYSFLEFARAVIPLFFVAVFLCEETQVNGVTFFIDYTDVTMRLITWMGAERIKDFAQFISKGYPGRIKGFNYYNVGPVFETIMTIFKPLLSEKLRKRINVHKSMVPIYDQIDLSNLPEEYLPDDYEGPTAGTIRTIAEKNIQEYFLDPRKREFLKDLYSGKYGADPTRESKGTESMASFRKLSLS